jgi:hypothetical protein
MKVPLISMLLVALPYLSISACASPNESSESGRERSIEKAATALEGRLDADSLAAAALLRQRDPAKTLELLARATQSAPDRPDLAWLHVQVCGRVPGCDSRAQVEQLKTLSQLCSGARLDDRASLQDCRAVALALERGDTDITEMEGANIAQRVWPKDSPEWLAANAARRVHEYRTAQLTPPPTVFSRTIAPHMNSLRCAPTIIANRMSGPTNSWRMARARYLQHNGSVSGNKTSGLV